MIVFLYAWLITLVVGWLIIDELHWWWRLTDDNLQHTLDAWCATIDDLEAAQRRIRELEMQRDVEGEGWKQ